MDRRVHYSDGRFVVCRPYGFFKWTVKPEKVTCDNCRVWMDEHAVR